MAQNRRLSHQLLTLVLLPVLAVAAVHPAALQPFIDRGSSYSILQYHITKEEVANLQSGFHSLALRSSNKFLEGVPVAIKQTAIDEEPTEWVLVDLIVPEGDEDEEEVLSTVAYRSDNFYSVGVTNSDNRWQCFAGVEDLITGCSPLPFGSAYVENGGLINRSDLGSLELGKKTMVKAVRDFRGYATSSTTPTTDDGAMKISLATLALVISEGARFTEISDLVRAGWETGAFVTNPHRFVYWSRTTCALADGWTTVSEVQKIEQAFGLPVGGGKEAAVALLNVAIYAKKCERQIDALV